MQLKNKLVVFDLETTGTWVEKDKIVEIGIIKCDLDGTRETYLKRVNPGIPIPKVVSELIGIYDKDVCDELPFKSIANEVLEFIGDSDLAGFNVERFDLPLLQREMEEAGLAFNWRKHQIYDAQKVYHLNEKRDLTAALQFYCNKKLENAHSALADTEATLDILIAQAEKYGKDEPSIEALAEFDYKKTADFFDAHRKFRWWNGKLYMMFGKYAKIYSLQELVKKDRGYLEWVLSANFSEDVKELIEDTLKGKFPSFQPQD